MSLRHVLHAARLARKQLFHNKVRLLVALAGIAFAVLLIFMQTGFRIAIFKAAIIAHERLDADLVLFDRRYVCIANTGSFSRRRLTQCLADPRVASVTPVTVGTGKWKNPLTGVVASITVYGMPPERPAFRIPGLREQGGRLHRADAILFDRCSRPRYGPIVDRFNRDGNVPVIINETPLAVAGLYELGKSFDTDGSVLIGADGFAHLFPDRPPGLINFGLVKLTAGAPALEVRDALRKRFGDELSVDLQPDFVQVEYDYTDRANPIGFVFNLGLVMGLIVGMVIVYQVLFADVAEHFAEYATLKAIGYSNAFLFAVVGMESLFLALVGFAPGFLASWGLYRLTFAATSLPMFMTPPHVAMMLAFTVGMCAFSGGVALYKVAQADPADVF